MRWVVVVAARSYRAVRRASENKIAVDSLRKFSVGADRFFLEFLDRVFVTCDEVVGPKGYFRQIASAAGEDYRVLFPMRRDLTDTLYWTTFPMPAGWKLESPMRAPPKPDGLDVLKLPEGGRFETRCRDGLPDGSFRAYREDGRLWAAATFEHGRVTRPCWNYPRVGSRFDESTVVPQ